MKEIIFLSFGNISNYVFSHFWNLNDEVLKNEKNPFNLNHNIIYDDSQRPRALLFDYSENIRRYYQINEKISDSSLNYILNQLSLKKKKNSNNKYETNNNEENKNDVEIYKIDTQQNNFINMMNDLDNDTEYNNDNNINNIDDEEENEKNNYYENENNNINNKENKNSENINKEKLDELLKLSDLELYEYFDFENSIKNWNDFLRIKFPSYSLNEIKIVDIEERSKTSYLIGKDFLGTSYGNNYYYENFEDNFRKILENCDRMELLHINSDFNSYFGGITNYFIENIHEMCPKNLKIINGFDNNCEIYYNDNIFNIEKYLNYIWFLSDIIDVDNSNVIFNPFYLENSPKIISDIFNYNNIDNKPVYNFYYTSLCALQLQNFYLPFRSNYFGKNTYIKNLLSPEPTINFIESDLFINLEEKNNNIEKNTNGYLINFSRYICSKKFNWEKLLNKMCYLNKFNNSIIYGINKNIKIFDCNYEEYLKKLSNNNFFSEDKYELPISFPRKYYNILNKNKIFSYKEKISLLTNNRPFYDFSLKIMKNFKNDYKKYDMTVLKYLSKLDNKDKQMEYKDKCEAIFEIKNIYSDLAENYLNEFSDNESEEDYEI